MKYEDFIKKLDTEDEDFEAGMLSDLRQKPPINLHSEIMNAVNRERKKPIYMNYRIYAPLVAAVLVIAIVVNNHDVGRQKGNIIGNNVSTGINNESALESETDNMLNEIAQLKLRLFGASKGTDNNSVSGNNVLTASDKKPGKIPDKVASTAPGSSSGSKSTETEGADISSLEGVIAVRYENVNYEIVLETPQNSITGFLINKENCKQVDTDIYMMNSEKFNIFSDMLSGSQINKTLLHKVNEDYVVVRLVAVNYQLISDTNTDETVKLIKNYNGKYIKNNIYSLSKINYDKLSRVLSNEIYFAKPVNDLYSDNVMLKIVPVNYELSLKGASIQITNYLANKDNAQPLNDNVYKFTKDSFASFEQLLSNEGIVKTTVNEPNNDYITVKINN